MHPPTRGADSLVWFVVERDEQIPVWRSPFAPLRDSRLPSRSPSPRPLPLHARMRCGGGSDASSDAQFHHMATNAQVGFVPRGYLGLPSAAGECDAPELCEWLFVPRRGWVHRDDVTALRCVAVEPVSGASATAGAGRCVLAINGADSHVKATETRCPSIPSGVGQAGEAVGALRKLLQETPALDPAELSTALGVDATVVGAFLSRAPLSAPAHGSPSRAISSATSSVQWPPPLPRVSSSSSNASGRAALPPHARPPSSLSAGPTATGTATATTGGSSAAAVAAARGSRDGAGSAGGPSLLLGSGASGYVVQGAVFADGGRSTARSGGDRGVLVPAAVKLLRVPSDPGGRRFRMLAREVEVMRGLLSIEPSSVNMKNQRTRRGRAHPHLPIFYGVVPVRAAETPTTTTATDTAAPPPPPRAALCEADGTAEEQGLPEALALVMELFDQGSLSQCVSRLRRRLHARAGASALDISTASGSFGALRPREVAAIVAAVASALAFMHARGVVHRDVKNANVVLSSRSPPPPQQRSRHSDGDGAVCAGVEPPSVCLIDFGISADASVLRTACGTRTYMAPEVALCAHLRQASPSPPSSLRCPRTGAPQHVNGNSPGSAATEARSAVAASATDAAPVAPRGLYGPEVDVFSLGVVMQHLLSDGDADALRVAWVLPPCPRRCTAVDVAGRDADRCFLRNRRHRAGDFYEETDETGGTITESTYVVPHHLCGCCAVPPAPIAAPAAAPEGVDGDAVSLINALLDEDPARRPTAAEVLVSPFVVRQLCPELCSDPQSTTPFLAQVLPSDELGEDAGGGLRREVDRTLRGYVERVALPDALCFVSALFSPPPDTLHESQLPALQSPQGLDAKKEEGEVVCSGQDRLPQLALPDAVARGGGISSRPGDVCPCHYHRASAVAVAVERRQDVVASALSPLLSLAQPGAPVPTAAAPDAVIGVAMQPLVQLHPAVPTAPFQRARDEDACCPVASADAARVVAGGCEGEGEGNTALLDLPDAAATSAVSPLAPPVASLRALISFSRAHPDKVLSMRRRPANPADTLVSSTTAPASATGTSTDTTDTTDTTGGSQRDGRGTRSVVADATATATATAAAAAAAALPLWLLKAERHRHCDVADGSGAPSIVG